MLMRQVPVPCPLVVVLPGRIDDPVLLIKDVRAADQARHQRQQPRQSGEPEEPGIAMHQRCAH
eukprot:46062-Eustigmatos_ZCMA.PRE.1